MEKMLKEFLNNTASITKQEDDELIYQLTTLKNPFSEIPTSVITDLDSKKYDQNIPNYIEKGEHEFTLLVTFLISRLEVNIRTQPIQKMANEFDNLLKINKIKSIVKFDEKIENCVNKILGKDHLMGGFSIHFILWLEYIEDLLYYGDALNQRNKTYLYDKIIIPTLNDPGRGPQEEYKTHEEVYVNLFLKYISRCPEACCKQVQKGFAVMIAKILGFDYLLKSGEKIPLEKINYLISDDLIRSYINIIDWTAIASLGIIKDPNDSLHESIEIMKNSMENILYISTVYKIKAQEIENLTNKVYILSFSESADNGLKSFVQKWKQSINEHLTESIN